MTTHTCQKIEKGQNEVRTCANHLDQRHRAVLLMVNGEKTYDGILAQPQPLGVTQAVFDELEGGGCIRPHLAGSTTVKAVSTDEPTPVPASTSAVPAVSSKEPAAEGYQRPYRFYTEAISRYLDLRGYSPEIKAGKVDNVAEFVTLRDALRTALSRICGEPETSNMIAQPDLLVDEAAG